MEEINKKDNIKNAFCYIPFVAIILYFIEKNKTLEFTKHMNYWIILFVSFVLINFILNLFYFLGFLWYLLTLFYVIISAYFVFKAWNWYEIRVEILDKIESETLAKIKQ